MRTKCLSLRIDESYTWLAIQYLERNPVSASMVAKGKYEWSSAVEHCGLKDAPFLKAMSAHEVSVSSEECSAWLVLTEAVEISRQVLRRNVEKGLPGGGDDLVSNLGKILLRNLQFRL